ncbi:reverse transcriptase-like protein [Sphingomonas sp. Tas61C01]|uniref:reverse transcriptase-like protein n=1 Tax=Sphingomonas sp. Tas61C01 TaxID=3458297 RepID=UPI00403EB0FE
MRSAHARQRIFFDGGCRPNPGRIETAVVANGVARVNGDAGLGDNNDAEWLALIAAARLARELGIDDVEFVGDSAFVVAQASGTGAGRTDHLANYRDAVAGFASVRVRLVPRAKNLAGIALAARHPR